jgi:hypothetical protein
MRKNSNTISYHPTYWLTRFMILRLLGFVYFIAYLSLAQQLRPLIGKNGLTPASLFLSHTNLESGSFIHAFCNLIYQLYFGSEIPTP